MSGMKKLLVVCAVAVFSVMALAGCGDTKSSGSASGSASGEKILRIGTNADFAPFEFQDASGKEYQGFDMDLIRAIGKEMGYKVEIQNINFDGLIPLWSLATST